MPERITVISNLKAIEQRQSLFKFFSKCSWKNPLAITLTLKQSIVVDGIHRRAGPLEFSQNLRHFLNVMKKRLFGNNRGNRILAVVPVIELTQDGRHHYHLQLDVPAEFEPHVIEKLAKQEWPRTRWGNLQVDVRPVADEGWLDYMLKHSTKPAEYADGVDWVNCSVAPEASNNFTSVCTGTIV